MSRSVISTVFLLVSFFPLGTSKNADCSLDDDAGVLIQLVTQPGQTQNVHNGTEGAQNPSGVKNATDGTSNLSSLQLWLEQHWEEAGGGEISMSSMLVAAAVVITFAILWSIMVALESDLNRKQPTKTKLKNAAADEWRLCENGVRTDLTAGEETMFRTMASLRKLRIAAVVTGMLMVVLLIVGKQIGSLALFGDGIHLMGDCLGYFCLFFSTIVSQWRPGKSFTYGYGRAELLCSLAVLALQYHEAVEVASEAYERFGHATPMRLEAGKIIVALSVFSTLVNVGLVMMLSDTRSGCGHNHGDMAVSMAFLHICCDVGQNLIVLITGCVLWVNPNWHIVDPVCVIFFLAMLMISTLPRICEITRILMEAAPDDVDPGQLRKDLLAIKGVEDVQNLQVWCLSPGKAAATANIYVTDDPMDVLAKAEVVMKHKYAISKSTLQVSDDDPPESQDRQCCE
eukprot:TRINITY_DN19881_c0_g1_i2.p1 TRINITY_DN19881_c0_g1~~TRINITY_DN19881_c0_g1_i2.p1  ORF type:complete len:456 (+),score=68.20 TRINITY_DN19881_c0_g1_i2:1-1368(+)